MATMTVPPPLAFSPKPLRTAQEVQEATGRAVLWKTSDFRLTYTKREMNHFCSALAAGKERGAALKFAVTPERYRMIGNSLAKAVEAMKLWQLPEVQRAVNAMKEKRRKALFEMDMTERRGHCARIARKSSSPPNAVINAVMADARLAKELDDRPVLDVTFNQVLASLVGTVGLPSASERVALGGGGNVLDRPVEGQIEAIACEGEAVEAEVETVPGERRVIHPLESPARIVAEMMMDEEEAMPAGPDVFGVEDGEP